MTQSPELPLRLLWDGGTEVINRNAVASLGSSHRNRVAVGRLGNLYPG
jgi:hypothetical protein